MLFRRWKPKEERINKAVALKGNEWLCYRNEFDRPSKDGSQSLSRFAGSSL
jgi:hypothetical protein